MGGFGARARVEELARWWSQASEEARWLLLRQTIDIRAPKKGAPTINELRLAIFTAETHAGEIDAT